MKKLLVVFLVLIGMRGMGQVPTWEWARSAVCESDTGYGDGTNMINDALGNVYVTGAYQSPVTFGTFNLDGAADTLYNMYLVKYDNSGNVIWAKTSSGGAAMSYGIALDSGGNIFLTGLYVHNVIFENDTLFSNNGSSIFILKYDSSGNVLLAKGINNNSNISQDRGYGIKVDILGNSYITGTFTSSLLTFGTQTINNLGIWNIFIAKFDPQGNAIWAKSAGGNEVDFGYSITLDSFSNVYICGYIDSQTDYFGTDSVFNNNNMGLFFIAKYDSSGNFIWERNATGNGSHGYSLATDAHGNIIATGNFGGTAIFNTDTISSSLGAVFIIKYDSSGNVLWVKNSLSSAEGRFIITDNSDNVYITGSVYDSVFKIENLIISNAQQEAMFAIKLDSSGNVVSGFILLSTTGDDWAPISIGESGSFYLSGDFAFDQLILGNDSLIVTGQETPFLAKFGFNNIEVGIPQITPQPSISLYPNPFSSSATLSITNYQLGIRNGEVQIFNLLGQEVKTIPIINPNTDPIGITINRDNLPDGMYFYKIINQNKETLANGKFVVE